MVRGNLVFVELLDLLNNHNTIFSILKRAMDKGQTPLSFKELAVLVSFGRLVCGSIYSKCSDCEIVTNLEILLMFYNNQYESEEWRNVHGILVVSKNVLLAYEVSVEGNCLNQTLLGGQYYSFFAKFASPEKLDEVFGNKGGWSCVILRNIYESMKMGGEELGLREWWETFNPIRFNSEKERVSLDNALRSIRRLKSSGIGTNNG